MSTAPSTSTSTADLIPVKSKLATSWRVVSSVAALAMAYDKPDMSDRRKVAVEARLAKLGLGWVAARRAVAGATPALLALASEEGPSLPGSLAIPARQAAVRHIRRSLAAARTALELPALDGQETAP